MGLTDIAIAAHLRAEAERDKAARERRTREGDALREALPSYLDLDPSEVFDGSEEFESYGNGQTFMVIGPYEFSTANIYGEIRVTYRYRCHVHGEVARLYRSTPSENLAELGRLASTEHACGLKSRIEEAA